MSRKFNVKWKFRKKKKKIKKNVTIRADIINISSNRFYKKEIDKI